MAGFDHMVMGLGAIGMILVWLVPSVLVVWLLSRGRPGDKRTGRRAPLAILDERYARGGIRQDEYHARRTDPPKSASDDGTRP